MQDAAPDRVSFGFREVPLGEKQDLVDDVFHKVAERYDLMNDLMSGGLHRAWKTAMVTRLNPPKSGKRSFRVLDMAGGTGDVATRILAASNNTASITVGDINASMLAVGRERADKRGLGAHLSFEEINAEELPFAAGTFNAYTIAFGIRNVPRRRKALEEAFRVLKPGGMFLCLEFAPVDTPILEKVYDAFSFRVIPRMGAMVTGDADPYQYLVESIRAFPRPDRFQREIEAAGFDRVAYTPYSGGIAVLHTGIKL